MSAYLDALLAPNNLDRCDILDGHDGFFVAALRIGDLMDEDQVVEPDPLLPPQHCCDPVHAKVVGQKGRQRRKRLARSARWIADLGPGTGPYLNETEG